jgi:hypothetical protein
MPEPLFPRVRRSGDLRCWTSALRSSPKSWQVERLCARMFEHFGSEHIQLESAGVIETPEATHLRFRVVK